VALPRDEVRRRAEAVLARNRHGVYTCPSVKLYPHQWLWDSCFTAIGLAHLDPSRAAGELRALLRGQWANGMVPHMIFADGVHDIGSSRVWQSHTFADAPRDVATSCITQPPLVALAVEYVARALPDAERIAFLDELFPKLEAYHAWLFRDRVLDGSALVTLIHPWECGLDSTPPWMQALAEWKMPWWLETAERLHLARFLRSLRYDTRYLPAAERASDDDGLRMLAVAMHARRYGFDLRRMPQDRSVLIEDCAFNAMLAAANRSLLAIADEVGTTLPDTLRVAMARHRNALEDLWDDESGQYCSRYSISKAPLRAATVATFLPLWAGTASTERAARLTKALHDPDAYGVAFPVPSVPVGAPEFQPTRYWKGPTWVNMNWAIVQGLDCYGEANLADDLCRRTLDLVDRSGCREYFSPLTGEGHGADEFSWTAALTIALLARERS
jgi:glycogen debranching enzyme